MSTAKTSKEQANADEVETIKRQRLKEKLLRSLENTKSIASSGVSTEGALYKIRQQEINRLPTNEE